jgi:DNA-binding beta-propeller fold protein YncE
MKMKAIKHAIALLTVCLLIGGAPVYAFSPEEAVRGEGGRILFEIGTFAGSGRYGDAAEQAALAEADFRNPLHVLALPDGSFLVADSDNHVIRQLKDGQASVYAGFHLLPRNEAGLPVGTLLDGPRHQAVFRYPAGMALGADGSVYVADSGNHAIRKIDAQGNVTTVAGDGVLGFRDGTGAEARFNHPMGVALGPDGSLYVADTGNHAIRRIDRDGRVTTLNAPSTRVVEIAPGIAAEAGDYRDGPLKEALFNEPYALVFDAQGNLYVSDAGNQLIRYIDLAAGRVHTAAGKIREPFYEANALYALGEYADGAAAEAAFHAPKGLALASDGSLVIADSLNHAIRLLKDGRVTTLAGSASADPGFRDGIEKTALFYNPTDVERTADGLLIADAFNGRIRRLALYRLPADVQPAGAVSVVLNGRALELAHPAVVANGRTMLAAVDLAAALGLTVAQEDAAVTITDGRRLRFTAASPLLEVADFAGNVAAVSMDVQPYADRGVLYVPVRFLAEALGLDVEWHAPGRTVILRSK